MRTLCTLLMVALLLVVPWPGHAETKTKALRVLFYGASFSTINRNDALASTKAWIESVGQQRGFELGVSVDTYETVEELDAVVRDGRADLIIVNSAHYLDLASARAPMEPVFATQQGDAVLKEYVILTQRGRFESLADLRNRQLIVLKTTGAYLGPLWMEKELTQAGLPPSPQFFGEITEVTKASSAVLPVFFGKADACVVDRDAFEIMRELNPQIGKMLGTFLASPPFLESVLCIHHDYQEFRTDLIDGLAELHQGAAGRSLLTVFKLKRLVPFHQDMMESIRALTQGADQRAGGIAR